MKVVLSPIHTNLQHPYFHTPRFTHLGPRAPGLVMTLQGTARCVLASDLRHPLPSSISRVRVWFPTRVVVLL